MNPLEQVKDALAQKNELIRDLKISVQYYGERAEELRRELDELREDAPGASGPGKGWRLVDTENELATDLKHKTEYWDGKKWEPSPQHYKVWVRHVLYRVPVEPKFKVGDWAQSAQTEKLYKVLKEDSPGWVFGASPDFSSDTMLAEDNLRKVTFRAFKDPEEAAEKMLGRVYTLEHHYSVCTAITRTGHFDYWAGEMLECIYHAPGEDYHGLPCGVMDVGNE